MVAAGLATEVEGLLGRGYDESLPAMQGIGYEDAQRRLGECTIATANGEQTRYMDGIVWLRRAAWALARSGPGSSTTSCNWRP